MIRCSEVKLGKAPVAEAAVGRALELCRQLYNAALQERRAAFSHHGKSPSRYDQHKSLTQIRAEQSSYGAMDVQMTRITALDRLDRAYEAFFRRCKSGETPGYPRFKGYGRFHTLAFGVDPRCATNAGPGWKIDGKKLVLRGLPGAPTFRMKGAIHRQGPIKGVRIVKKADRYYAQFLVDVGPAPAVKPSNNGVGIDVGLRTFASMSDGKRVESPRFLKQSLSELATASRALATKKRGSHRRAKAKVALQRVHVRVKNRRTNFIRQTVAQLVKTYNGFAIEQLDIQEMASAEKKTEGVSPQAARGMRRGIMDAAWGQFGAHLASKAEEAGMPVVRVNPKGTSQRCSGCGSVVRKTLRDRIHDCPACGLVLDRDLNAARNIYDLGQRSAAPAAAEGAQTPMPIGRRVLPTQRTRQPDGIHGYGPTNVVRTPSHSSRASVSASSVRSST